VQSRGLLLDPTNGLADLERQEVRALSIHAFTNQPIRLMRILRYAARMGFRLEPRTKEWFDLAVERGLNKNLQSAEIGEEFRALSQEENPVPTLKAWEEHDLLEAIHPQLQKRKPDYDSLNKLARARINLNSVGIRTRLARPVIYYTLGKLKPREATGVLKDMGFKSSELENYEALVPDTQKIVQMLKNKKLNAPRDAYAYLSSLSGEMLSFLEVEFANPAVMGKLRNYLQKWRPMRMSLPMNELDALGVPRGMKFDKIMEQLFEMQLRGKGKLPEERVKIFRQLAGIKDELKKKPEKEKKKRGEKPAAPGQAAPQSPPAAGKVQKPGMPTAATLAQAAAAKSHAQTKQPAAAPPKPQKPAASKTSKSPSAKKANRR
jgi:tRNA nucleotidyltransferase (CCA-adding enzyme)